jgi:two-component system, sensor histidine kinase
LAYLGIFGLVTLMSMLVALLLSTALQKVITEPLDSMANVARQVTTKRDYSLRAQSTSDDEIGIVVEAFNSMLDEVQARARALEQSNTALTSEVHIRQTAEAALARANTRLESTMAALREADRKKDEFLATLAHELRNPLAPIRYALATARKCDRTAEQRRRAEEIIERQVAHMSRLLDDLLDMSRITRGTLELKLADTELTVALGTAIEAARPFLDAKRHNLSLDLPKQAVRLVADSVRLAQVFSNLLINAAKYTDCGGRIELRAAQADNEVVVSVRDNGMGISTDMMPRLFTMFAQDSAVADHSEGGLGIGLALARGVVDLHGGRVEARSDGPGHGSEFIVTIPVRAGRPAQTAADADQGVRMAGGGMRVLVVDDNRDAADSCSTLLELSGHSVQAAYTGHEALAIAAKTRPHVVVTDIGLPDIDGYEVAARIRAEAWGRTMILVAVTGWGQESDKQRAFSAGFSHHLTKPIDPDTLESLLQSLSAELPTPG